MNNRPWDKQEIADMKVRWDATKAPASVFAHEYATEVDRSAAAIRLKIGQLIADGKFEAHGAEFGPAQVLVIDVETLPAVVYSWGIHDQNIGHHMIIKDIALLAVAATWLYSGDMVSWVMKPREAKERDDKRLAQEAWKLLEKAEVVIAHNGRGFDVPKLNMFFVKHGLKPPGMYKVIDTYADIRSVGFTSKAQDYIGRFTNRRRKLQTNFDLWRDCDEGKKEALAKMQEYNRGDVAQLEEIYTVLRPWISNHPNLAVFEDHGDTHCPVCQTRKAWGRRRWPTKYSLYPVWKCPKCGAVGRGRFSS